MQQAAAEQYWRLRTKLAASALVAAAILTPTLWLAAGNVIGDFLIGVWLGTLAAFISIGGPLLVPQRPQLSRVLVVVGVLAVAIGLVYVSPSGFGHGPERAMEGVSLIVFVVGALAGHASWTLQINRLTERLRAQDEKRG